MKMYSVESPIEWPDVGDIKSQARKSSVGKFKKKGGDYKGYSRKSQKRRTRISMKKRYRAKLKKELLNLLD